MTYSQSHQAALDYQRIEKAIGFLQSQYLEQPDLASIARAVHMSEFHFQKIFTRWAGISPKRFLQFLTVEHAKDQLAASKAVLGTALDSGLSGPGRLHDLFVSVEAVSPGEFKSRGTGLSIDYGFHPSPFGLCLIGNTDRGVCWLSFLNSEESSAALLEMKDHWSGAQTRQDQSKTAGLMKRIFSNSPKQQAHPIGLLVMGTNFQLKVWQALLRIPSGALVTYEALATSVDAPRAARAIGSAVGQNPISYLIPCHRVIRKTGILGDYRWGSSRKKAILAWEAARSAA